MSKWGVKLSNMYQFVTPICMLICKTEIYKIPFGPFLMITISCVQFWIGIKKCNKNHDCGWTNWTMPQVGDILHCLKEILLSMMIYTVTYQLIDWAGSHDCFWYFIEKSIPYSLHNWDYLPGSNIPRVSLTSNVLDNCCDKALVPCS